MTSSHQMKVSVAALVWMTGIGLAHKTGGGTEEGEN